MIKKRKKDEEREDARGVEKKMERDKPFGEGLALGTGRDLDRLGFRVVVCLNHQLLVSEHQNPGRLPKSKTLNFYRKVAAKIDI